MAYTQAELENKALINLEMNRRLLKVDRDVVQPVELPQLRALRNGIILEI